MKEIERTITDLHKMMPETLVGLIHEEDESSDIMLVFEKHTVLISGKYKIRVEERKAHP